MNIFAIGALALLMVTVSILLIRDWMKSKKYEETEDEDDVVLTDVQVESTTNYKSPLTGRARRRAWRIGMSTEDLLSASWIYFGDLFWDDYDSLIYFEYDDGTWVDSTSGEVYDAEYEVQMLVEGDENDCELTDEQYVESEDLPEEDEIEVETVEYSDEYATLSEIELSEPPAFELQPIETPEVSETTTKNNLTSSSGYDSMGSESYDSGSSYDSGGSSDF